MHYLSKLFFIVLFLATNAVSHQTDLFRQRNVLQRPRGRSIQASRESLDQPGEARRIQRQTQHFLTSKTEKFAVDGTRIPDVNFDVGESYAGLLPISSNANETRELFFWFFPAQTPDPPKEIAIWLNGGPGCSSFMGLLQENGPFLWQPGSFAPVENQYAFNKLTNVIWVEQPVGVGFSTGSPDIVNEVELSKQFVGFYEQFVKTFDAQGYDLYLTGESYAGFYVPYIANEFVKRNNSDILLKGVALNDPILGDETLAQGITVQPFVDYWQRLMYLNDSLLQDLAELQKNCGYEQYLEKYMTFPPPQEKFPVPTPGIYDNSCDPFDMATTAATAVNPCFNPYHISDTCPTSFSILNGGGGYEVYFNRTDVKEAIHAPVGTTWSECANYVFSQNGTSYGDESSGPAQNGVLRNVIEHTNNVIIGSGNLDYLLNTNGTLLTLQNTTWNGFQGFKEFPGEDFIVPVHIDNANDAIAGGVVGRWGSERGLTFYQVQLSGHELPEYAPEAWYRVAQLLLGRIGSLSDASPAS